MKVVLGKEILIERNGTQETIKMPIIDFIDQLSNLKGTLLGKAVCHWLRMHARLQKDVVVTLDGQAKIHRSGKS
jgi:regulator of sigma E protease